MIPLTPKIVRVITEIANLPSFKYIKKHAPQLICLAILAATTLSIVVPSKIFDLKSSDVIALINSVSSVVLSFAAIHGIMSWKRQKSWERQTKSAEDITMLFYRAKDAIHDITSPLMQYETPEKDENYQVNEATQIVKEKIKKINDYNDIFIDIESKKYEFNLILGEKAKVIADDILKTRIHIISKLYEFIEYTKVFVDSSREAEKSIHISINGKHIGEEYQKAAEEAEAEIKECKRVIYGHADSPIKKDLERLQYEIESIQDKFIKY